MFTDGSESKLEPLAKQESSGSPTLKATPHSRELPTGKSITILKRPRTTILVIIGLTSLTLILNIVWLSWAAANSTPGYGDSVIFRGDCSKVKQLKLWLHVLINILSTVLVTGSSYCMARQPFTFSTDTLQVSKLWTLPVVKRSIWHIPKDNHAGLVFGTFRICSELAGRRDWRSSPWALAQWQSM